MKRLLVLCLAFAGAIFAQCPATPVFPSAIATDANLGVAANRVQTTLLSPMQSTDSVAAVTNNTGWVPHMTASVDNEIMFVTAVTGNVLSVSRACEGTTAATHALGATILNSPTAASHGLLAHELEAVEQNVPAYQRILTISPTWGSGNPARGTGDIDIGNDGLLAADMFHILYEVGQQAGCPPTCNPQWNPLAIDFTETLDSTYGTGGALGTQIWLYNNTNSYGSNAFTAYAFIENGTTTEAIAAHGECDHQWVGAGVCVAHNSEGSTVAGDSSELIGYVANMETSLVGEPLVYGADIVMNYHAPWQAAAAVVTGSEVIDSNGNLQTAQNSGTTAGSHPSWATMLNATTADNGGGPTGVTWKLTLIGAVPNPGAGVWIHAANGSHTAGLQVEEDANDGGTFTNMAVLLSRNSTDNRFLMYNGGTPCGTNTGCPDQIIFGRGTVLTTNRIGMISSDIAANGNYTNGNVTISTANSATLNPVVLFDYLGNINAYGHYAQIGSSDNAGVLTVSSSTTATHTFANAYQIAPACTITPNQSPGAILYWVTATTTVLTITLSSSSNIEFTYVCMGNPN